MNPAARLPDFRSPPNKIIHNLWQGGIPDTQTLARLGITAIINMDGQPYRLPQGQAFKYLTYEIDDAELPNLAMLHEVAAQGEAWLRSGERLLVHCAAGWNRSGLTNGLILIQRGMKGAAAVELIQRKRKNALGNAQFRAYLRGYEADATGTVARKVEPFQAMAIRKPAPRLPLWEDDEEDDLLSGNPFSELDFDNSLKRYLASLKTTAE